MNAEIVVVWPFLLDGHIRLQLVLETIITSSQDGVAQARILALHFCTRRPAEASAETTSPVNNGRLLMMNDGCG